MHYVRASLALMAAGCGRLEFSSVSPGGDAHTDTGGDGRPCVAVGHDEDGDGFDDACDLCPQRADSQVDSDGDGIGDACDLHPTAQTRTLFDPFRTALPAWSYQGTETFVGDAIAIDALAGGRGFSLVSPPGRETYEIAGRLISAPQTVHQLAIRVEDGVNGAYYCELYDDGTSFRLNFTYTLDSVAYTVIDSQLLAGRFQPGTYRIILDRDPPNLTCIAEWMGTTTTVTGAIPGGLSPVQLSVGAYLLSVELDSFTRVTTP